jgi:hypothetical protein
MNKNKTIGRKASWDSLTDFESFEEELFIGLTAWGEYIPASYLLLKTKSQGKL